MSENTLVTNEEINKNCLQFENAMVEVKETLYPELKPDFSKNEEVASFLVEKIDVCINYRKELNKYHIVLVSNYQEAGKYIQVVQTILFAGFFAIWFSMPDTIPYADRALTGGLILFSLAVFGLDLVINTFLIALHSANIRFVRNYFYNRDLVFKIRIGIWLASVVPAIVGVIMMIVQHVELYK